VGLGGLHPARCFKLALVTKCSCYVISSFLLSGGRFLCCGFRDPLPWSRLRAWLCTCLCFPLNEKQAHTRSRKRWQIDVALANSH
jgi:hypothetical protein